MLILVSCLLLHDSTLALFSHSNKLFVSSVCLGFELGLCLKLLKSQLLKVIRSLSAVFKLSLGCYNEAGQSCLSQHGQPRHVTTLPDTGGEGVRRGAAEVCPEHICFVSRPVQTNRGSHSQNVRASSLS